MSSGFGWRLDPDPQSPRWSPWETAALLLWFAVAGFAVAQHVPWADEVQSWMLTAGVGWKSLFLHNLHYEGEGGLWQICLKLLQTLHMSFGGMRWVVLAAQGAGMAVLLRWSPFPRVVRLLLPFMFFLLYQDAVVARAYCLFAVLAFPAAVLLRGARPRPLALAFLAGLLAMLSLHGVVLAAGLGLAGLLRWHRRVPRRRLLAAAAVLLAFFAITAYFMTPLRDIDFAAGNNLLRSLNRAERTIGLHPGLPPPSLESLPMYNVPAAYGDAPVHHARPTARSHIVRVASVVTYPLSSSRLLALLLVAAIIAQAFQRQGTADQSSQEATNLSGEPLGLVGLLPYLLMLLVFQSFYLQPRHAGTLLTGFLVAAWLTWPAPHRLSGSSRILSRLAALLLLLVGLQQTFWTLHAIAEERTHPYAPGRMTAAFLQSRGIRADGNDRPIAGYYYFSITPLLYFNRNIYFNQLPHRYWLWSTANRTYSTVQQVLAQRPPIIVVGTCDGGPEGTLTRDWEPAPAVAAHGDGYPVLHFFETNGYHETHKFCGHRWMRGSWATVQCETILEPMTARDGMQK